MSRAMRRHKNRCAKSRLVNSLFAINTAYDTKDEIRRLVQTGGYREQVGRRGIVLSLKRPQPLFVNVTL